MAELKDIGLSLSETQAAAKNMDPVEEHCCVA